MQPINQVYLETADAIGVNFIREALWDKNRCTWLSAATSHTNLNQNIYRSLSPDFYEGTSGISFFLMHLYQYTNDSLFKRVAEGALNHVVSTLNKLYLSSPLGFYTGVPGACFALIKGGEILNREDYRKVGLDGLKKLIGAKPTTYLDIDVIAGVAGSIPLLLSLRDPELENLCIEWAHFLMISAEKETSGWSWNTMPRRVRNLTGYAHGAAGIGSALFELYVYFQNKEYLSAATAAFSYEDHYFNQVHKNWPDFRDLDGKKKQTGIDSFAAAWCHGAPGIALSRIRAYEITSNEQYLSAATTAVSTTISSNEGWLLSSNSNLSLCHGLLGNAECVLRCNKTLNSNQCTEHLNRVADYAKGLVKNSMPLPSGLNNMEQTPGFMLGNAGIGYFFLRLFNSESTPSVLLL